jgi:3-oxoacyl-(acyl-carrier-protein) synthase
MGRLLKYGTTAGLMALRDASIDSPDAISTGTGFGLLEDSGKFLKNITETEEGMVSPTAFIQSTHNTVSSNIALVTGCRGHNNTFVHKAFSMESALTDAQMLMTESTIVNNILAGAYDELTDYSYAVMDRLRLVRSIPLSSLDVISSPGSGTVAGEGATFALLSRYPTENTYAVLRGCDIIYRPSSATTLGQRMEAFLSGFGLSISDIDVVISGLCGDTARDHLLRTLIGESLHSQTITVFKHLCGEYMTSSAFAIWMGAMMIHTGSIPPATMLVDRQRKSQNILIANAYKNDYAFTLLTTPQIIGS